MIWALLEITLPLCLAFLLGITGGWLFWRWRRRYIKASEWDSKTDSPEFRLLQEEYENLKNTRETDIVALESLETQKVHQASEMRAMHLATQKLADELKIAKTEQPTTPVIDNSAELDKLKSDLADQKTKADELSSTNAELTSRADHQTELNNELQQKLKQSETVASERDAAIERIKELEAQQANSQTEQLESEFAELKTTFDEQARQNNELQQKLNQSEAVTGERDAALTRIKELEAKQSQLNAQGRELSTAKEELAAVQQKFKNIQASVMADRQRNEQEKESLQSRISQLEEKAAAYDKQAASTADNIENIRQLETRIAAANDRLETNDKEKGTLRTRVTELESQLQTAQRDAESENNKREALDLQLVQANSAASELNQSKARISTLNTQLNDARMTIANQNKDRQKLVESINRNAELATKNAELIKRLEQSKSPNNNSESRQELRELQRKYAEVTAQLNNERSRNTSQASVQTTGQRGQPAASTAPVTPISDGQIKRLKSQISTKDERIAELEKKLKNKSSKQKKKNAWQKGTTEVGTPGCDHKDDLTVINGIGPKIEKVLNKLGIKSWEQLAAFRAAEVKLVDAALEDFPGRITRDEWVSQAKAIMRNGHQPLNKKSKTKQRKKPKNKKATKKAWQQGETRFGTPGSIHRDDLKVINGIGPVIEQALNRRGVRSWEQLADLKAKDVKTIDEALDFPGRIKREQWVQQAKALIKQFPVQNERPNRTNLLNKVASR